MFNQGAFNQMPFNRPFSVDVYGSFILDSTGDIFISGVADLHGEFSLQSELQTIITALHEKIGSFVIASTGELEATVTRERSGSFAITSRLELSVVAGRYRVEFIEFDGEFAPGDKIVIDSNTLKMTLNNQNALHMMNGDFFDLNIGENDIVYTDDQSNRKAVIRITHRDKFV